MRRMKNIYSRHRWQITDGYDIALDGEHPRKEITCARCGEVRRIGCSLNDRRLRGGCRRLPWPRRYVRGDLVIRDGALDRFTRYEGRGQALTWNAGGHGHISVVTDLKPY